MISHGSVWFAYQALALLVISVSAIYVYLTLNLKLDRITAIFASNLICLLPFVQEPALTFFAESALFPAVMGTIYHLIRSDYLQDKYQSFFFIICASLAILIRPVEAVTDLALVFCAFFVWGYHRKIFSFDQILKVFVFGVFTLFILALFTGLHFLHHYPFQPIDGGIYDIELAKTIYRIILMSFVVLLFSLAILGTVNYFPRFKQCKNNNSYIIFAFTIIFAINLIWYMPYIFKTFVWLYRTSFGDLAQITANSRTKLPVTQVLYDLICRESRAVLYGISIFALLGIFANKKIIFSNKIIDTLCVYLILLIPFSLWEVLNTIQSSPRKLNVAFPALLMVALIIGFQCNRQKLLNKLLLFVLIIFQFWFATSGFLFQKNQSNHFAKWFGNYPLPITLSPNPHEVIIKYLTEVTQKYHIKHIVLAINAELILPADPFLLLMMQHTNNTNFTMIFPYYSTYSDENAYNLSKNSEAVFLADVKNDMNISKDAAETYYKLYMNESNPNIKTLMYFLYHYSNNTLYKLGWKLGPCVEISARDNIICKGCVLFSKNK